MSETDNLLKAIENGDPQQVASSLDRRADPNVLSKEGVPALHLACEKGNPVIMGLLLQSGADIDARIFGTTAGHSAADRNLHGMLIVLLEYGFDPNSLDDQGDSPLHRAARRGSRDAAYVLLTHGVNPNIKNSHDGHTPLHDAARQNQSQLATLLLDNGADISARDVEGATPLIYAVQAKRKSLIELFLNRGAMPNECDDAGRTPLIWAATKGDEVDVIQNLLEKGANPAVKDGTGNTALSRAKLLGHQKAALLLEAREKGPA